MADTLDSGKKRSSGFRSAGRGSGPTGPGGPTRPTSGRPKSRGDSTRPSSGASLSSTGRVSVRGGAGDAERAGAIKGAQASDQHLGAQAGIDAHFKQLEAEAQEAEAAKQADAARTAAAENQSRARQAYSGSEKDVKADSKEALKSAPDANRPLTDEDRRKYSTPKERAAAGKANPLFQQHQNGNSRLGALNNNFKRNRSKWIGGGGIVGLFMVIIISFIAILPLKLESLIKNILENRIEDRIHHYMDKRYERLVTRYLASSVGVGAAGADDAAFERTIIAYGQPIRDFYRTWRVNKFEAKLEAHQGIRFQRTAGGGGVDVYKDGRFVGTYTGAEGRAVIKAGVFSETKAYQVILRFHLLKWNYYAYQVRKLGNWYRNWRNSKKNPATTDDEIAADNIDDAGATLAAEDSLIADCFLSIGDKCFDDPNNRDEALQQEKLDTQPSSTDESAADDIKNSISDSQTSAADKAKQYLHNIAQNVGNPNVKTDRLAGRILTKFFDEAVAKDILAIVGAAKGPLIIISLVDVASQIDHFFYYGAADKMLVAAHEVEYAHQFASWASKTDEWKDGKTISGDEFNSSMSWVQDVQKSQAFQHLYLNNTSGQPLTKTDDGTGKIVDSTSARSIDEHAHPIEDFYKIVFGDEPSGFDPGLTNHIFFNGWYQTGHRIWQLINDVIGLLVSFIFHIVENLFPPLKAAWDWLTSHMQQWIIDLLLWIFHAAVDGTERNADLYNGLDAGGTVQGIGLARNFGAPKISQVNATQLDSEIARDNQAKANQLPITARLFSTDYNHSLVNTMVVMAPSSPSEAVNDSLGYFASLTQNPFRTLAPLLQYFGIGKAHGLSDNGAGPDNLYGMYDWGYTDAQLDADDSKDIQTACQNAAKRLSKDPNSCGGTANIAAAGPAPAPPPDSSNVLAATATDNSVHVMDMNLSDCPEPSDPTTQPDLCRLDIATMQALAANSTDIDNAGLNAPGGNP